MVLTFLPLIFCDMTFGNSEHLDNKQGTDTVQMPLGWVWLVIIDRINGVYIFLFKMEYNMFFFSFSIFSLFLVAPFSSVVLINFAAFQSLLRSPAPGASFLRKCCKVSSR